jgi:hypothetical protein
LGRIKLKIPSSGYFSTKKVGFQQFSGPFGSILIFNFPFFNFQFIRRVPSAANFFGGSLIILLAAFGSGYSFVSFRNLGMLPSKGFGASISVGFPLLSLPEREGAGIWKFENLGI